LQYSVSAIRDADDKGDLGQERGHWMSLDEFLGADSTAETAPAEPQGTAAPQGETDTEATSEGTVAEATESTTVEVAPKHPEPDPEDATDDKPVPRKALIAERRKRQELERQLARTQGFLDGQQAATGTKTEDEEDNFDWVNPSKYISQAIQSGVSSALQEKQRRDYLSRVEASRPQAMAKYADYEEMESVFAEVAGNNEQLKLQAFSHPDPAEFAYKTAKTMSKFRDVASIDDYEAKIRQKVEAEVRKKLSLESATQASTSSAAQGRTQTGPAAAGDNDDFGFLRGVSITMQR